MFYHDAHSITAQPADSPERDVLSYDTPTLLSGRTMGSGPLPISVSELLQRWFDRWEAQKHVLQLLLGPLSASFMSLEHRYSSTFQSAEALHQQLRLGSKDVSSREHGERQRRVLAALETAGLGQEDRQWAGNVLASRNDKSLTAKITDLVDTAGAVGAALREAVVDDDGTPCFGREASQLRGGVAHPSTPDSRLQERRRVFLHALRWLIRAHILATLFEERDRAAVWEVAAGRSEFQSIIEGLGRAGLD